MAVNEPPSDDDPLIKAASTLEALNERARQVRGELAALEASLAQSQSDAADLRAQHLVEANEHLVIATLQAQAAADTAVSHLGELTESSQRDPVTGLPNRALMRDRIESAIAASHRRKQPIAVLFVDLDHFKQINDTLGHVAGDEVLQQVAHRLESAVRNSDTVSRHGGDEFLVLLTEMLQPSDAAVIAARMLSDLAAPCFVGNAALNFSASVGIALHPTDGTDAATLIKAADAAMYRAKKRGGGRFEFHANATAPEQGLQPFIADALQHSAAGRKFVVTESDPRLHDLREANEKLVIAALDARELMARAQQAHARQSRLLAIVAHELRHPLTPIGAAADLLTHPGIENPLLTRVQGVIKRQVARMARLSENLLEATRTSPGAFELGRGPVDMAGALAQAVETCRPAIDARQQRLHIELPTLQLHVHGDAPRLAQIFANLLDNASKYTPQGGELRLSMQPSHPPAASQGTSAVAPCAVISVADNGIGITEDALPRIFELFVQDPQALSVQVGGLGIGLAVVRHLAEAHGGTVEARSAGKNLGSEFVVTLPLAEAPGWL